MLRSILVGLDGSAHAESAMRLGIEWARRVDALLVGIGVIDEPTIAAAQPVMIGGPPYADPIVYRERMADARRQVEQFLGRFALACAQETVACKVLEDVGLPCERIAIEAQRYDLVLLGGRTCFHFETQGRYDDTLSKVLKGSPAPVVVVPESWRRGRSVVVAYDGSPQAARALRAFRESGLDRSLDMHVVSVHAEAKEAARCAERAIDFLRFHGIAAAPHALATRSSPAGAVLEKAQELDADVLVMGAYGRSGLKEFFLGSVTRTVLKESEMPVFLCH